MTRAPEDLEPGTIRNLDRFLDKVENMDLGPLGYFTCEETEALADAMTAQRGPEKGQWVIIHHLVDSEDEEDDELQAHLDRWPDLAATLRAVVVEDHPIIEQLTTLEES